MLFNFLLLFCAYLPLQIALNPAAGVDLASGRVLILALVFLWLVSGLKNRFIFISAQAQTWLIFSFLFLSAFSLFWAENINWGLRKLLFLLSVFPIYFVTIGVTHLCFNKKENPQNSKSGFKLGTEKASRELKIIKFLVWGAGLAAIGGIVQFSLQFIIGLKTASALWQKYVTPFFLGKEFSQAVTEHSSWLVNIVGRDYLRAFGFFPDPHMFSFYLGLILPLAAGLYYFKLKADSISLKQNNLKKTSSNKLNIYLVLVVVVLFANLLTFSRGGYLGLAAGLIFAILCYFRSQKISAKKIIALFVLTAIALILLSLTPVGKRFYASFSAQEGSNKARIENWRQALEIIKNNPQGVGVGNYAYEVDPSADYRKPLYAHNLYLDIAAETGIISALLLICLLILSIRNFIIKARDNIFYFGAAVSLVIFSVHSFFDTALYSVQVLPLFLIIIALSAKK